MPEHRARMILMGFMLISLFLPLHRDTGPILMWVIHNEGIAVRFLALYYPFLTLINAYLVFHQARKLKGLYRILLFIYVPFQWFLTLSNNPPNVQLGYWAIPVLTSVAGMLEIVLMIWDRLGRKRNQANRTTA